MREPLYNKILNAIVLGTLAPGEKLNEADLSKKFKVSRTPLRESLFQLENIGFLSYEQNKGFRVPKLSKEELRDCYPIIWCLEAEALNQGFLLLRARISELKVINEHFGKSKRADKTLAFDKQFHDMICRASGNLTLQQTVNNLKLRMQRYDMMFFSEHALIKQSFEQHQEIILHIHHQKLPAAIEALKANWQVGLECMLSKL